MTVATKLYSTMAVGPLTDRSTVALTTASLQIVAENKDRRFLMFQNASDVVVALNLVGGTAAIGAVANWSLAAGASLTFEGAFVPSGVITAIAASGSGKQLICLEG